MIIVGEYLLETQLMSRLGLRLGKKTVLSIFFSTKASLYQSEEKILLYYLSKFGASIFKAIADDRLENCTPRLGHSMPCENFPIHLYGGQNSHGHRIASVYYMYMWGKLCDMQVIHHYRYTYDEFIMCDMKNCPTYMIS